MKKTICVGLMDSDDAAPKRAAMVPTTTIQIADLRETNRADADDFSGEQFVGLDGGEQDFKDARGFLFDDGTRDVHAIEEDDHVHEEEQPVGDAEGFDGVAALAVCADGVDDDGLHELINLRAAHAAAGERLTCEHGAQSADERVVRGDVGGGAR